MQTTILKRSIEHIRQGLTLMLDSERRMMDETALSKMSFKRGVIPRVPMPRLGFGHIQVVVCPKSSQGGDQHRLMAP